MSTGVEHSNSRIASLLAWPRRRAGGGALSHGAWVVGDQAVVSLVSFLATVIVGRTCGQFEMGVYGLAVSVFWLAAGIPNSLVWTPYTSRAAKLSTSRRAVYAGSVTFHSLTIAVAIAGVLIVLGIGALLSPLGTLRGNTWFAPMCFALAPFVVFMVLREHVRRLNLADLRTRDLLAFDAPIAVVQLTLLLLLAQAGKLSATTALVAIAAACSLTVVWIARHRDRFRFRARRAAMHWSYNQQFGRWLLVVSIAWLLGDASYRWLVGSIQGMEALGRFAAAQSIVLVFNPLLLTANNLAQAFSARAFACGGAAELRRIALHATALIAVGAGLAFGCLAIMGGVAVRVIFGPEYSGLGSVVAALCLGMFAHSLLVPIEGAMVALRQGRGMLAAGLVRLVVVAGAGAPLIWWRGLEGVGYAMALSSAAAAAVQWSMFLRSGVSSVDIGAFCEQETIA